MSLAKYWGELPPPPYGDTLVAARLLDENHFVYDLGSLVDRAFRFRYDKLGKRGVETVPYSEAHLYSYLDAKYTWLLWQQQAPLLVKEKVHFVFELEMEVLPIVMDMEMTGIAVDESVLEELSAEFLMEMARLKVVIDDAAGFDINLNANRQIAELVYEKLGHRCPKYTKTGQPSTDSQTLELFSRDPVVAALLEHAKLRKLQGTFIDGLRDKIVEGEVHPSINQTGAKTGRLSSKEPNIQQIPSRSERGKRVRSLFVARPQRVFVVSDLSQIELRVLAHFTQDPVLLRAYREGQDLHSMTASTVFGPDFTPEQRGFAKNGNFSIVFGAGPQTLVNKYGFPNERTAKRVLEGFYKTYRRVDPWKADLLKEARDRWVPRKRPPYVLTVLGRKRRLPDLMSPIRGKNQAAERQAVSTVIQGSAADLFKVAMLQCHTALQGVDWEGHILMTVHDELVVEVPEAHAEEGLLLVKGAMEEILNPFTGEPLLSVPIEAVATVVDRWSEAK